MFLPKERLVPEDPLRLERQDLALDPTASPPSAGLLQVSPLDLGALRHRLCAPHAVESKALLILEDRMFGIECVFAEEVGCLDGLERFPAESAGNKLIAFSRWAGSGAGHRLHFPRNPCRRPEAGRQVSDRHNRLISR